MLVTLWFEMVTDLRCWWQNHYVGDFFRYVGQFLNVLNRSSISWIGHQHLKLFVNTFGLKYPSPKSMLSLFLGCEHYLRIILKIFVYRWTVNTMLLFQVLVRLNRLSNYISLRWSQTKKDRKNRSTYNFQRLLIDHKSVLANFGQKVKSLEWKRK